MGEKRGPVTLPGLYVLLQHWQPPEEANEPSQQPADIADNSRRLRRAIARTSGLEASRSPEWLEPWWADPSAPQPASHRRRSPRRHSPRRRSPRRRHLVSGDAGFRRDRRQSGQPLLRLVKQALKLLKLRAHAARHKRCPPLAPLPQLPPPTKSSLFLTWNSASQPMSAEDMKQLHDRVHAEHRAWLQELRRRGRRLLAIPEPEPFWLPHMLGEGVDTDSTVAAAAAAATAAAAAVAIEHCRQSWSAARNWPHDSDCNYAATSCSDTTSDSTSSSSSCFEQDATAEYDKDLPSEENI